MPKNLSKQGKGVSTEAPAKLDYRTIRKCTFLSQEKFWGKIGVTQSAGSRYESDHRTVPKSVTELVRLYYLLNFKDACAELKLKRVALFGTYHNPNEVPCVPQQMVYPTSSCLS